MLRRCIRFDNYFFTPAAHHRPDMSDSETRPDGHERRRVNRTALRLNATVREPGRSRVGVKIIDVSTHGCRIESNSNAAPDSWVLLSIAGLETQYCRIVWQCEQFAGLEFAKPLADPVLDQLVQGQQDHSEATISELRDLAARTHRVASKQGDSADETLAELSRQCAVDAVVEALRMGDQRSSGSRAGKSASR